MKIFDAHLHFFSSLFFETMSRMAAERSGGRPEDLLLAAAQKGKFELPRKDTREHLRRWFEELDRHGVDRAAAFASLPEEAEAVQEACAASRGRLVPYTMVNPAGPAGAAFARRALKELGFRGILLFPSLHHYQISGEACVQVLEEARSAGAVVLIHCGVLSIKIRDLLGLPRVYDMRFASPLEVMVVANRFPEVPFVIPHFGAGLFREALIAGSQCPNIHIDTSSSNNWMETQPEDLDLDKVFRRTLKVFGPQRILFGSDSTTFPRGWREDVYQAQAAALERVGVSSAERELIFGRNLARIMALSP